MRTRTRRRRYGHVVDAEEFAHRYPIAYHMAEDGAWPSIQQHGLLSTAALVDLFDPPAANRHEILQTVRRRTFTISHPEHGSARIRDQLPLKFLEHVLTPDTTQQEFLDALNGRVFFWVSRDRLAGLLNARMYRTNRQTVLHVDSAQLLASHAADADLAPYNTGSMHVPTAPRRGKDVFRPFDCYPWDEWRRRRPGRNGQHVVELTVRHSVPLIRDYVRRADTWYQGEVVEVLYER
jgi:hypothetical protein